MMCHIAKAVYKKNNLVRRSDLKLRGKLKQIMRSATFVWSLNYVFIETFLQMKAYKLISSVSHTHTVR